MNLRQTLCGSMVSLAALTATAGESRFFAMDTGTRDAEHQTPAQQAALVSELGFDGISATYSTPEALAETLKALDEKKLALAAVYLGLKLDSGSLPGPEIKDAIQQLRGRDSILWLYVQSASHKPSDPEADALAVPLLRDIATMAAAAQVRVALYPHKDFWIEKVDDAVRVAKQVDHPNLGVTFNLCHWLATGGNDLDASLTRARPHLMAVTINGADKGAKEWSRLIQPLGQGDFDVRTVLTKLRQLDWHGPVGLQHFGIPGSARTNLKQSIDAWHQLQEKAE